MKTEKELEELVRQALSQPRSKFPLVVDIGRLSKTISQTVKACEILGLSKRDLVRARWIAVDKSRVLKENPDADYSQVLEKIRKTKESKMGQSLSFKERVVKLKEEMWPRSLWPRNYTKVEMHKRKEEENIKKFINLVIEDFEQTLQYKRSQKVDIVPVIVGNIYADSLSDSEFNGAVTTLKEIGFKFSAYRKIPRQFMQLSLVHRKVKGTTVIFCFGPVDR